MQSEATSFEAPPNPPPVLAHGSSSGGVSRICFVGFPLSRGRHSFTSPMDATLTWAIYRLEMLANGMICSASVVFFAAERNDASGLS